MGYRLNIDKLENGKTKNIFYGTKLYGYADHENFLSFMYLVSIGKLDKEEYFDYGTEQKIVLNKKEFTIFINLYNIDMNIYYKFSNEKDIILKEKEIAEELLDNILYDSYNDIYIIDWC